MRYLVLTYQAKELERKQKEETRKKKEAEREAEKQKREEEKQKKEAEKQKKEAERIKKQQYDITFLYCVHWTLHTVQCTLLYIIMCINYNIVYCSGNFKIDSRYFDFILHILECTSAI